MMEKENLERYFWRYWLVGLAILVIMIAMNPLFVNDVSPWGIRDHQSAGSAERVDLIQGAWHAGGEVVLRGGNLVEGGGLVFRKNGLPIHGLSLFVAAGRATLSAGGHAARRVKLGATAGEALISPLSPSVNCNNARQNTTRPQNCTARGVVRKRGAIENWTT